MIKLLMLVIFMKFMLIFNKKVVFYYNLCYLMSLMFLCMYMYKDSVLVIMISLMYGVNFFCYYLYLLSLWMMGLIFMNFEMSEKGSVKLFSEKLMMFMVMMIILLLYFSSLNLMMFYLMFELSLIPTFFLIIYWGKNFERISAAYYLLMYTMFISLPLLVYVFKMMKLMGSLDFYILALFMKMIWGTIEIYDYFILFMAFYIKMPIYLFHVWLPKAHVEAPVYGSMILASILLKLGSYGLMRFLELFSYECLKYNYLIFSIGIVGGLLVSLICLVQVDMKSLVAYSSVVHMNLMLCSLMTLMKLGYISAYIMMISHGLCSSGLFFMVNLFYERTNSRLLMFNKGMVNYFPSLMIWWFILCVANFSFPFSLGFISEIFLIMVIMSWEFWSVVYLIFICFFSSAYSLYLYSYVFHGGMNINSYIYMISLKDFMILLIHVYPMVIFILNLSGF